MFVPAFWSQDPVSLGTMTDSPQRFGTSRSKLLKIYPETTISIALGDRCDGNGIGMGDRPDNTFGPERHSSFSTWYCRRLLIPKCSQSLIGRGSAKSLIYPPFPLVESRRQGPLWFLRTCDTNPFKRDSNLGSLYIDSQLSSPPRFPERRSSPWP